MRPVSSEAVITPEELVPLGYPQERIDETDQDQQCCCVTYQEARGAYCRSTPDIFTKPLTEGKFRTSRGQMYGHEPEQAEPKDDGPAPENMGAGCRDKSAKNGENPATGGTLE
jgi:hypothetical protein